jgi:hypothetical protein
MHGVWEAYGDQTERMQVPGGYIYRVVGSANGTGVMALVFVPDPIRGAKT